VAIFAIVQGHADEPVDRRSDGADGFQFLVDDVRGHIPALKQISIQSSEIAIDPLAFLNMLDTVDGSRLALAKELSRFFSFNSRHFAHEVIAERRKVRRCARRHATSDWASINDGYRFAPSAELIGGG
jgi:hypothetical protein